MKNNEEILVRIVDDDSAIRETLTYLLTRAGFDCRAYEDARSFLIEDTPSIPGCLILDVRMPEMSGLALQSEMNRRGIRMPIVFFSGHGDLAMAVETMRKGATTFLQKSVASEDLLAAVAEAVEISLSREGKRLTDVEVMARWETLAQREKDIAFLMGEGKLTSDISRKLEVSAKTIYNYRVEIHRKLMTSTQADIARFVYRIRQIREHGVG